MLRDSFFLEIAVCTGTAQLFKIPDEYDLVRIATGGDAADASVVSIFGAVQLEWMSVSCTADSFLPMTPEEMTGKAILLEP